MENLFIPSDLALKLKFNNFDVVCMGYYQLEDVPHSDKGLKFGSAKYFGNHNNEDEIVCSAPTYHQVEDWFLEKHNIDFEVDLFFNQHPVHTKGKWFFEGYNVTLWKNKEFLKDLSASSFSSKRLALNFAFDEALKLI